MPTPLELRPLVKWFAQQLESVLRDNDHKQGWHRMLPWDIHARLAEEMEELTQVLAGSLHGNLVNECADVAIFCAFLAYNVAHGRPESTDDRETHANTP